MTAAELVALARKAAHEFSSPAYPLAKWAARSPEDAVVAYVCRNGLFAGTSRDEWERNHAKSPAFFLLGAVLTPDNTTSPEALTRALLASAVTIEPSRFAVLARLRDCADSPLIPAFDDGTARGRLLDALLASPEVAK